MDSVTIEGVTYPLDRDVMKLTVRDMLLLEYQSEAAIGRKLTMHDVQRIQDEIDALKTKAQKEAHPDARVLFAIALWKAQRRGGKDVTFAEALEFDPETFSAHMDPRPEAPPDPRRGGRPGSHRAGQVADHKRKASGGSRKQAGSTTTS